MVDDWDFGPVEVERVGVAEVAGGGEGRFRLVGDQSEDCVQGVQI